MLGASPRHFERRHSITANYGRLPEWPRGTVPCRNDSAKTAPGRHPMCDPSYRPDFCSVAVRCTLEPASVVMSRDHSL
jgi:hypothetical protein